MALPVPARRHRRLGGARPRNVAVGACALGGGALSRCQVLMLALTGDRANTLASWLANWLYLSL